MVYKGEKEKLFLVLSLVGSKVQVTQSHAIGEGNGMLIDHVTDSLRVRGLRQGEKGTRGIYLSLFCTVYITRA